MNLLSFDPEACQCADASARGLTLEAYRARVERWKQTCADLQARARAQLVEMSAREPFLSPANVD